MKLDINHFALMGSGLAALSLALILFGTTGERAMIGLFIFALPIYLIMNNFELGQDEKIVFAFFLSLAFFGTAVWYANRIIPSLTYSMIATFILLSLLGIFWKKLRLPGAKK